ncbi:hypothetical protein Nepgr_023880 [Nepenthes gracilis]|uniref:Midasin n=1 Tax=Nepenthes gracilis TaxID=150966 RepID=A0AAD3T4Q3_NEPGR|nr:hypothetical protein Nepgr_023880 [Nepenthes gracilis]
MAVDGSFCLHSELDRFLARCPKLSYIDRFSSLLEKCDMVTEEEVVDSMALVFLHPSYTIPIMGCFRPVARKIFDKVVALLKLVPNLSSNNGGAIRDSFGNGTSIECENMGGIEAAGVIEVYWKSGRGLDLHELACFAFSRALDLMPSLKRSLQHYFEFAPSPFVRIPEMLPNLKLSTKAACHLVEIGRTAYRILLVDPEYFASYWNWCCILDLLQQIEILDVDNDTELVKNVSDVRWCGIQILAILLKLPSITTASFGLKSEEALACLLRWQEFCCDTAVENAGWYLSEKNNFEICDSDISFTQQGDTMFFSSEILKSVPPRKGGRQATRGSNGDCNPFVMTSAVKKSFERVVLAVSLKWPVLLYGPAGSGKTALINKLAKDSGNRVLSIHMDEQIDGRTLIGSYVCTEDPGEFRWQPGSLTQAVMNGLWVVFENIDQAPSDVQSILLPLLEGGGSLVTGHGEAIRISEGFRIFSTISSSMLDISHNMDGRNSFSPLWRRVMVRSPSSRDLVNIISAWYPDLEPVAEKLTATFEMVNQFSRFYSGTSGILNSQDRFSTRDLLKWCRRIAGAGFSIIGDNLPAYIHNSIFLEAVDIFSASSASLGDRRTMMESIAKMWAVPVETLNPLNKPIFQDSNSDVQIGRVSLQCTPVACRRENKPFVGIRSSLHALERIACSVKWNEPVLLVGETGTGKTTLVQSLAMRLGQKLTVLNLSQQSDIADLLGGFKPTDPQTLCIPLYMEFENLFSKTFPTKENKPFLAPFGKRVRDKDWNTLLRGFRKGVEKVVEIGKHGSGKKRKRPLAEEILNAWKDFSLKLEVVHRQITSSSGMLFSFVEGAFVTALKNGGWILLDEVNLAPPETLQRILGVLDGENGSLCLAERGDVDYLYRHPGFRIFACMNPATEAGKRDLPYSLRSRFSEYFVDDVLNDDDLALFVSQFIDDNCLNKDLVSKIVCFYKAAKKESDETLQDGANQKPQYSLRSLYRALEYARKARGQFGFHEALYDGFCMFFMTLLDEHSANAMNRLIVKNLLGGVQPKIPFDKYMKAKDLENYVLTRSVKEHLKNLARAMLIKRYPVLLQGPTSSGKTSLVRYLAAVTDHEFVRINNHEHTDLQEYFGSYIADASGKLVFHEGVLVKAVRKGYWIVLDELNLAPSEVLEALNRLLDDNRELFVPELHETIRAHPEFMLFATQNPPIYAGRKMLSRAFRNRFVEIHVNDIPEDELSTILEKRCKIPESYAKKMVEVMKELQLHRQRSKVFAGKHGFITLRDLFRWADRFREDGISYEDLVRDGYLLLAERLPDETEKNVVQEVLERHFRTRIMKDELYKKGSAGMPKLLEFPRISADSVNIVWTESMLRLYFLIDRAYKLREPVLLVGETGGGKTTVCQLLSLMIGSKLHMLNCHQYTETSDFIGGFYPIRERSRIILEFKNVIELLLSSKAFINFPGDTKISSDINQASQTLNKLAEMSDSYRQGLIMHSDVMEQELVSFEQMRQSLSQLHQKWQTIFMWQDGPLVHAMKNGDLFLVDEISLADDSVLERLNSVLEPERKLSLAEKGGADLEKITAHPNFFLLATMNPGGDYGKKELSPALRNRFTEIWVPPVSDLNELRSIAMQRFSSSELHWLVDPMLNFWEWFNRLQTGRMLTVRDLLSWVAFINTTERSLLPDHAFLHGAFLVLLDGLTLGTSISKSEAEELRMKCLAFLVKQLQGQTSTLLSPELSIIENYGWGNINVTADISDRNDMQCSNAFGIQPFYIEKGDCHCEVGEFEFLAPTTRRNVLRVLRAMQLAKPVLLEGSPGVGKTSLIIALAKFSRHKVVRINLSEQMDMMDLLGSDMPVESEEDMKFAWSDGILLQALKEGSWVLLDELNLAPQSVLEGLNAILDHRAEVFIPELGMSFKCPCSFRLFACQNPSCQGGGRKGLPKSFLNRFTKVYVDELNQEDYHSICSSLFPAIPSSILTKLISFNKRLYEDTMLCHKFAQDGSPWEFNLRDVIRSCQIIQGSLNKSKCDAFLNVVYVQRMRTAADRNEVLKIYEQIFGVKPCINPYPRVHLNDQFLVVGNARIKRNHFWSTKALCSELKILPGMRNNLEAAAQCVQQQWLCILIGPTSSGKTSLVRLLAHLTGNVLNEINLSSATDISDLLGCFEQYNAFRNFQSVLAQVERYANEYCSQKLESSANMFLREGKDLVIRWLSSLPNLSFGPMSRSGAMDVEKWNTSLSSLVEIIELLRLDMEVNKLSLSWSCDDLDKILQRIQKLQGVQYGRPFSVKFEWAAGLLLQAIDKGEWILLEDANLCNPTVLDRINSLAESNGSITINERGNVEGKPLILLPHPDFRMFLTVNPSYGEVSRAMRNRGVEVFMMQPCWLLQREGCQSQEIESNDIERFLALSNIPSDVLVNSMAKAHIYARDEGLRLNVHITYLELARWVQLFHQLLGNGNCLLWSLQISWEHTYLSSLGESEGSNIVNQAKISYLSSNFSSYIEWSLCLPGGWPLPLKLRDFVWYPKETCVRQNCMYLEYLGSWYASSELNVNPNHNLNVCLSADSSKAIHVIDIKMLQEKMYPKGLKGIIADSSRSRGFDLALLHKMLLFSADWTIEQATEYDFKLYLLWFSWFSSQLQPHCQFFSSFLALLKKELDHSIWECVFCCRREILSSHGVDHCVQSLPMLAMEFVDLGESKGMPISSVKDLSNAINCVGLLRRSLWQWNTESMHNFNEKSRRFVPLLESLQALEERVLEMIVKSSSFDILFHTYTGLLEEHISFWNSILSFQTDHLLVHWHFLLKNVMKLQEYCPAAVKNVLAESRNLQNMLSWTLNSLKSMLWAHGGHPVLPSCAELYDRFRQLLGFSELVSPRKIILQQQADWCLVDAAVSSNPELRSLAMQGVCMVSQILAKYNEDECRAANELEEIYQMLLKRFEYEKHKLEVNIDSKEKLSTLAYSASCCVFVPEVICTHSGFSSWVETVPMVDQCSLFLDFLLLQELSNIVLADASELKSALSSLSDDLQFTLHFSLNFSSRPPSDLLPHQKLLWILDAWESVGAVDAKIASSFLEMWFRWHSLLRIGSSVFRKGFSRDESDAVLVPDMIFMPMKTDIIQLIVESTFVVKDYLVHCHKLRVASCNIWRSVSPQIDLHSSFLSIVRSLLQQIILAHRKSFHAEQYAAIRSIFLSFQEKKITEGDIQALISLLSSSAHDRFRSLIKLFIEPLLKEAYILCSSEESPYYLGCAWLRLGGLRFHLLLSCNDVDPTFKYTSKFFQLEEKISSLELEIKVRQECDYLAGSLSMGEADDRRFKLLEKLKVECRRLQRKIVFRPDREKYKKLKYECDEFLKLVSLSLLLMENKKCIDLQPFINQARNWQETANCFIDRLSDEYTAYSDIVQPIQVAVYEMKLGLSLLVSSVLQKDFLDRVQERHINPIQDAIYSLMRFPDGCTLRASVEAYLVKPEDPMYTVHFGRIIWADIIGLLEKLITFTKDVDSVREVLPSHLKASLYQSILTHVVNCVSTVRLLENSSFMVMDQIFGYFLSIWMDMKVQANTKKDYDTQQFKFRPREFKIEDICEVNLSSLSDSFPSDIFCEWKDLLDEKDCSGRVPTEEPENLQEWNVIQESVLNNMIRIHNNLFGSTNLIESPSIFHVSDADKLLSFVESYLLGAKMLKDFEGVSSYLDAKLGPEHLLRLCLELQQKLPLCDESTDMYNFYKDSNAPAICGMVKLLIALQQRVLLLLDERGEHPGLQKILDIIKILLAIPPKTPLAKALSGLQFLFGRVKMLQEDGSKFPLNDELEHIRDLACLWQKMEFDSWCTMLDEVLDQFEKNAGKLWFPLYSILHHRTPTNIAEYNQSTIQSIQEFIQTSNLGEFRRRLQLILAFYGQISAGISLKCYTSPSQMENKKILYNVFGFYVQCLPIVLNHIEASRRNIERELREFLKLCQWERSEKLLSIENSRRNRQKMKKLMQKYTDALQQPVMLILKQEVADKVIKTRILGDFSEKSKEMLRTANDLSHLGDLDRAQWYANWQTKVDSSLQNLLQRKQDPETPFSLFSETESIINKSAVSKFMCPTYQEEWNMVWETLETICRTATDSMDIWKDERKTMVKKRTLSHLLKLLENSGLSRHKSRLLADQFENIQPRQWFLLPSYDVQHLLLRDNVSLQKADIAASSHLCLENGCLEEEWKAANDYYFKSLASVQHLQQICVNIHKDFRDPSDKVQVEKSSSFLDHLILIQQEQRAAAYNFAERLNHLKECMLSLNCICKFSHSFSEETQGEFAPNQYVVLRCMWQQKELFDTLCVLSHEEALLLRTVESTHLDTCHHVKVAANRILGFIEKFTPCFRKYKALLDYNLLGHGDKIKMATSIRPLLISKEMEQFVIQNFQILKEFQKDLFDFCRKEIITRSVEDTLLRHFKGVIEKGEAMEKEFYSSSESRKNLTILLRKRKSSTIMHEENNFCAVDFSEYEAGFNLSLHNMYKHTIDAFKKLAPWSGNHAPEASLEEITTWKVLFEKFVDDLQLDYICEELVKLMFYAAKLANVPRLSSRVSMQFKNLKLFLDLILAFSDGLLHDFIAVHKTVAIITHTLAESFASLFSQGYGTPAEEQADEDGNNTTQDASGTGMGEGAGVKDVSEQITDEDQLLGTSEMREEQDALEKIPSKDDKGIEMEQDFAADTFSVSENSADDDDDGSDEDELLDSAMGKTGDDGEIVDEKLWDKEDDGNPDSKNEKYESGPSVKDGDPSGRELRAKEDSAAMADEWEDRNVDKTDENDKLGTDNTENLEEMHAEKEEVFADSTGRELDGTNQIPGADEMKLNPSEDDDDPMEEDEGGENGDPMNAASAAEEMNSPTNEVLEQTESNQIGERSKNNESCKGDEENSMTDLTAPQKDVFGQGNSQLMNDIFPNAAAPPQPLDEMQGSHPRSTLPEEKWPFQSGLQNDVTPSDNNISQMEIMAGNSLKGEKLADNQSVSQEPWQDLSPLQKNQPNPLRNVGDALQAWKERVKVSTDLQDINKDSVDDIMDEDADEYGFTSEIEKGTAQALGPAMPEQIDPNINGYECDGDVLSGHKENSAEPELQNPETELQPTRSRAIFSSKAEGQVKTSAVEVSEEGIQEAHDTNYVENGKPMESFVSLRKCHMSEDIDELSKLSIKDIDLGRVNKPIEVLGDKNGDATVLWRKYELRTTRLSQELAEQLRLVMEPTLASKLQGDYRTGKRINMKKVIPYIASHYRKDKIWLRRTKLNKRDYQVMIVVDDSRSMSESCCVNVAIEALVTVCRAMSQLEVGKLAVASFGKKGNISLLHDFDQPFTGEAAIKMISNLTFKQENTITDEPMVDLLVFLKNMLDQAVANARLPSGQSPLQQLVLLIADGRFHEKEKLKRYVRDAMSRKRMVAFLLLDSPQESIMDLMEASFEGGNMKFSKYLDSFPFPYYVVLRNIEVLPQTLADLLRQWFELMQHSRD